MIEKAEHSSRVIVHSGHIINNLRVLAGKTAGKVMMMSVVKADAYGHGAVTVSRICEPLTDWFGVASVEEGIELRRAGIGKPVLIFGVPTPGNASLYSDYNLTAVISSLKHFEILPSGTQYHLEFDTGMGRLGFLPEQTADVLIAMADYPHLRAEGIMSHFATADEPGSTRAKTQIELFSSIRSQFSESLITHMANSGGMIFYPESHFDMVRPGIAIYGYDPGEQSIEGLQPALSWEATVVQCRRILKGESVSYGARWVAGKDGYLLTIPAGYADGIPRLLSGKFKIGFRGTVLQQTGTVTMDYFMVFSEHPAQAGLDKVEILGSKSNHAGIWSKTLATIPYEILCGIHPKIKRLVMHAGT
jgi:alanine racemase